MTATTRPTAPPPGPADYRRAAAALVGFTEPDAVFAIATVNAVLDEVREDGRVVPLLHALLGLVEEVFAEALATPSVRATLRELATIMAARETEEGQR